MSRSTSRTAIRTPNGSLRTRERLSDALLELMLSHHWNKITVKDIIGKAGVGRSTFYSHFPTKFDLLVHQLPSLHMADHVSNRPGQLPDFLPLFEHVAANADALRPIATQAVRGRIVSTFEDRLMEEWLQVLARNGKEEDRLVARFLAGATLASMWHYLTEPDTTTSQEMADQLSTLVGRAIGIDPQD